MDAEETELQRFLAQAEVRDFYARRRVLVLGADGFLGRNMLLALRQLPGQITALTRRAEPPVQDDVRWISGDLADPDVAAQCIDGQDIVFNLVGGSGAVQSNNAPYTSLLKECLPQANLMQACITHGRQPFMVFCSSRLVYGAPASVPVSESQLTQPCSVYAAHKLTVESYIRIAGSAHGMPYCIFRLSNPYGPYQPMDSRSYGVINQFIQRAARGESIRVYGDGSQLRDYVYVDDVVQAFLRAVLLKGCRDQIFNLGGTEPVSVADAATIIARLADAAAVEFVDWPDDSKRVESGDYVSDMSAWQREAGQTRQLPFAAGVERTLAYYREALAGV